MEIFPISLKLQQQRCLIVGGGHIAYRKAILLVKAGAILDIVAPDIDPQLMSLIEQSAGTAYVKLFEDHDLDRVYRLVIAATDNADVNKRVFEQAELRNLLVNSVDDIPNCRFMVPAIIDRSPLLISVASNGASPVLSRQLRTQIETLVPHGMGKLAEFSGQWRSRVKAQITNPDERRIFWEELYASPLKEQVFNDNLDIANQMMTQSLAEWTAPKGEVYLVGAGPGDPELLTLKALRLMQQADVVIYDRLVSAPILELCRRDAEKVYVGKARSNHSVPQEGINALLVKYAQAGKRVCRLKGGDPFIFGRGGEEIQELFAAGIPFQVVPGITAASGCSAYAGIPLTHRDYAQSVRFLTGHLKEGSPELPWSELVYENQTLVLYMGLVGLEHICQQLIAHGQRPDMPVALVSKGTTPEQKVVVGTLSNIASKIAEYQIHAPTLTIIGEVVSLREQLQWL
ncbi:MULTISPECIES: siroheme synthase CysG [Acinetobacter]|uniref:Siroheme synthase n=2 Tax=Acinetobacter baylyi TaxID=202950 RepID=CYSG_ACIAD|nr:MULTISPECIES: siroheme synthase CysG [Acinetobacter]Q6F8G6.1 RecName: Full=Siroheme synthase; Includes: RecName: Full=Uroporphyrinogen-III C-methyltransferase; Short=Urogen III methylase; AltName: Full=SUMT; AltName: Full=Uroporphyrinogen III methylase; Short=UROM; Includes: RecName: Full=Precorrin-2 dehydrogenase; Includes: RecName: Full=Sirohydrochlorin ferrochelatase [Acinetobacter baylyi ADP1]ENV53196.1 siroheme synthase [Acinetobacter baylyi DSM 14961 = CIP 107474]KAF2372165.1 uroporphyr